MKKLIMNPDSTILQFINLFQKNKAEIWLSELNTWIIHANSKIRNLKPIGKTDLVRWTEKIV